MIRVTYAFDEEHFREMTVSGHAESGEYGKDLICAAVSSIMYGLLNAVDKYGAEISVSEAANRIEIRNHTGLEVVDHYFELVLIQLKTIEESYDMFIKVERKI